MTAQLTNNSHHAHSNIAQPNCHDVLSGRGAGITRHPGNKRWRDLIKKNRARYTALPRNQRPIIAESIVKAVRSLNPPGRFLTKDAKTQLWYDIGDERATEKTAQAMRDSKKNDRDGSPPPTEETAAREAPLSAPASLKPTIHLEALSSGATPFVAMVKPTIHLEALMKNNKNNNKPKQQQQQQCSPNIPRPEMNRLNTDDTFAQRMEDFTFTVPSSTLDDLMMTTSSHHSTTRKSFTMMDSLHSAVKPSPSLAKPNMARDSTFDRRLDEFTSIDNNNNNNRYHHRESGCSMASFGILDEEELEQLEYACTLPSTEPISRLRRSHSAPTPSTTSSNSNIHNTSVPQAWVSMGEVPIVVPTTIDDSMMMENDQDDEIDHQDIDDIMMEEDDETFYTKQTNPQNQTFHWSV